MGNLQLRRDTTVNRRTVTPLDGEIIVDTDQGRAHAGLSPTSPVGGDMIRGPRVPNSGADSRVLFHIHNFGNNSTYPGLMIRPRSGDSDMWKIASSHIRPNELATGQVIKLRATGLFTPGALRPRIIFGIRIGADLVVPSGNANGFEVSHDVLGINTLARLPADSRWTLEVTVQSLGWDTASPGAPAAGTGNVWVHAKLRIGEMSTGFGAGTYGGDGRFPWDVWRSGNNTNKPTFSYPYPVDSIVSFNGRQFVSLYNQAGETDHLLDIRQNSPIGSETYIRWRPRVQEYEWDAVVDADFKVENEFHLEMGEAR